MSCMQDYVHVYWDNYVCMSSYYRVYIYIHDYNVVSSVDDRAKQFNAGSYSETLLRPFLCVEGTDDGPTSCSMLTFPLLSMPTIAEMDELELAEGFNSMFAITGARPSP